MAKRRHKVLVPSSVVVHESEALSGDAPLAEPNVLSMSPVVTIASDTAQSAIVDQVKLMFASF